MQDYRQLITEKRKEKGLSQNQLAGILGVSQPFMNQIESGKRKPSIDILIKICEVLEIPLFGGMETKDE